MSGYHTEQLQTMEPDYLNSYGLREAPFSRIHQDNFLYLDAERAQRLHELQQMTQDSNLLLIVQGERGSGKTSLLRRFISQAQDEWCICMISANTMMDAEQLLFQAAQGFGLNQLPQDSTQLQELLYARVATLHHDNQIPILVIDDAHELPRDALLTIFTLADTCVDEENLLRIILFCEPQIEKILGATDVKALRERITHTLEIPPLDEESTAEYLKHRLAVAGFTGGSPFSPMMIRRIYRASHGLPGVINELAHETLEQGDFNREELADTVIIPGQKQIHKPVIYVSLALGLVALVWVFQYIIDDLFEGKAKTEPTKVATVAEAVSQQPQEVAKATDTLKQKIIPLDPQTMVQQPEQAQTAVQDKPSSTEPGPAQSVTGAEPATEGIAPATAEKTVQPDTTTQTVVPAPLQLTSIEPDVINGSEKPQTLTIRGQGFSSDTEVIVAWTGKEKKLTPGQFKIESDSVIKLTITTGRNADKWSVRVRNPQRGDSNLLNFQVSAAEDDLSKGDKWVLARNPQAFTLQLFGTNQQSSADQFIAQHGLKNKATYFHMLHEGKDWYSVVYGEYADQTAARKGMSTLPAALQKIKPWVRRFDDIHAAINGSRQLLATKSKKQTRPSNIPLATAPLPKNATAEQHASWLWSQDPSSYTLQILGSRSSISVNQFLRKYANLNGKAVYFHTRHNARDWYTVVYGVYSDKTAAKKAIDRLPPEIKSSSPWIRSFSSIHAELDRAE